MRFIDTFTAVRRPPDLGGASSGVARLHRCDLLPNYTEEGVIRAGFCTPIGPTWVATTYEVPRLAVSEAPRARPLNRNFAEPVRFGRQTPPRGSSGSARDVCAPAVAVEVWPGGRATI